MVKNKPVWLVPLTIVVVATASGIACIFAFRPDPHPALDSASARPLERRSTSAPTSALPESPSTSPAEPAPWPPEEIFRRAFWRQPTAQDQIIHAERRETADAQNVERWQWFLELHPGPELLRTLRDPDTFGLAPTATPRPWSEPSPDPLPAWFPASASAPDFEILQNPAGRLTLLYRAADNTLFATDTGGGFTPAVKPVTP